MLSSRRPLSRAAPSTNLPCGLLRLTGASWISAAWSRASRWIVCPSGTVLVRGEHLDPPDVPRVLAERLAHEGDDQSDGGLEVVHPGTHAHHVRVVVLAPELSRLEAVREGAPNALD